MPISGRPVAGVPGSSSNHIHNLGCWSDRGGVRQSGVTTGKNYDRRNLNASMFIMIQETRGAVSPKYGFDDVRRVVCAGTVGSFDVTQFVMAFDIGNRSMKFGPRVLGNSLPRAWTVIWNLLSRQFS